MRNSHSPRLDLRASVALMRTHLQRIAGDMISMMQRYSESEICTSLAEAHSFVKQAVSVLRDAEDKVAPARRPKLT
jgi:hypothetical protein